MKKKPCLRHRGTGSIDDEEVLDALVNESDELEHICELYQCKMAS